MNPSRFRERCARLLRRLRRLEAAPSTGLPTRPTFQVLPDPQDQEELESWENEGGAGARRTPDVGPGTTGQFVS
jgi:hypothetical protein